MITVYRHHTHTHTHILHTLAVWGGGEGGATLAAAIPSVNVKIYNSGAMLLQGE